MNSFHDFSHSAFLLFLHAERLQHRPPAHDEDETDEKNRNFDRKNFDHNDAVTSFHN